MLKNNDDPFIEKIVSISKKYDEVIGYDYMELQLSLITDYFLNCNVDEDEEMYYRTTIAKIYELRDWIERIKGLNG